MSSSTRRALVASAAIVVAIAAVVGIDRIAQRARPSVVSEAAASIAGELDARAYAAESGDSSLAEFEQEVLSLFGREDLRAFDEGGLVGFVVEGDAEEAFASLRSELEDLGWTAVSSGSATAGSFVKGGGRYRWAFVSCTGVGDATSVVVQCV